MSFAKIQWDFAQLIRQKLIYIFAEFGDEVLCVSSAGVSTSNVCHNAMVHSGAVTVHSDLSE